MKHGSQPNWYSGVILILWLATTSPTQAQVVSDNTLSTSIETTDNLNFIINKGNQNDGNLFHSFSEFSVPSGGSVVFNNNSDVQRIISRVTGSSISNIDGLIQARGTADVFLLNPNGIIFGSKAALNIGGSFVASTAKSLNFADGNQFSAIAPQTTPLLTVNVPVGLQFGRNAGSIVNQSQASNSSGEQVGLQVQPGKTLALVGGNVNLAAGALTTAGGQISLGSVADSSLVNLTATDKGWNFDYEGVQNFQDIQLTDLALVSTSSSLGSGDIHVQGKNVTLSSGSRILANTGSESGGNLTVNASNSVEVLGTTTVPNLYEPLIQSNLGILIPLKSTLSTSTYRTGSAGNLTINTGKLVIRGGGQVANDAIGSGSGGNLTVNASDSVEVSGATTFPDNQVLSDPNLLGIDPRFFVEINAISRLSTATISTGNAGNFTINTGRLIIRDGGTVSANPFSTGQGGSLTVNASDSVEVSGISASGVIPTTLTTSAFNAGGSGNLIIKTGKLSVKDGAQVSAATGDAGQGGDLTINASDSIELIGILPPGAFPSGLYTQSIGDGDAGNLTITTGKLSILNGAGVAVDSQGTGNTGNLLIQAGSITLDQEAFISAATNRGEGGNINLLIQDLLLLRRNSKISTNATGSGNGGNIDINSRFLVALPLEDSNISADAEGGLGGKVEVNSLGIFGIKPRTEPTSISDITASSDQGPQFSGVVEINTLNTDLSSSLFTLPAEIVDVSGLIAQGCQADVRQGLSKFAITGRGGLPPDAKESLRSDSVLVDLGTPIQESKNPINAIISNNLTSYSSPIIIREAQGWVINSQGEVVLTAQAPTITSQSSGLPILSCHIH